MSDLTELVKKNLQGDEGYIANNNYEVLKAEEDYCELLGYITATSLNPYGFVHGGYIFGLADSAAGIAARSTGRKAVTISSSIEYLHKGKGEKLKAIAKALKSGKNVSVYEVLIYDEEEKLIARSTQNYFYSD